MKRNVQVTPKSFYNLTFKYYLYAGNVGFCGTTGACIAAAEVVAAIAAGNRGRGGIMCGGIIGIPPGPKNGGIGAIGGILDISPIGAN